ncbi:MAG: hypothetical protein GY906_03835 [bacterium]|nr:hypothetical protein [bacterium]
MDASSRLVVQVPGMSRSLLADMLGGIQYKDDRFRVERDTQDANLAVDPATVAIVSTVGTIIATEIIKAAVEQFIEWVKKRIGPWH